MVVAYDAVTIGWRVLWLVARGGDPDALADRAGRAREGRRLLDVEALGQEHRAEPGASPPCTSAIRSRGDFGCPASP